MMVRWSGEHQVNLNLSLTLVDVKLVLICLGLGFGLGLVNLKYAPLNVYHHFSILALGV